MKLPLLSKVILMTCSTAYVFAIPITDLYTHGSVEVVFGHVGPKYNLLFDTASANTWLNADTYASGQKTGRSVEISYSQGKISGIEYTDEISIGGKTLTQRFGVGKSTSVANGTIGLLGLGPAQLSHGTVKDPQGTTLSEETVPTVMDNLYMKGVIAKDLIAIALVPADETTASEFWFGEIDSSKYSGDITYTKITTKSPANEHWGFDSAFSYGPSDVLLDLTAGFIDHSTTGLLLATDAFERYMHLTGAIKDKATGLLSITPPQYNNLQPLTFTVANTIFEISPNACTWPRDHNSKIGGDSDKIYLIIGDIGSRFGSGVDFVIGYSVLRRFYTVFDYGVSSSTGPRIGFATTPFTESMRN